LSVAAGSMPWFHVVPQVSKGPRPTSAPLGNRVGVIHGLNSFKSLS
jgi:hypothetical protein